MLRNIFKYGALLMVAAFTAACVQETPADPYFSIEGDHVSYTVNYEEVAKADAKVFTVRSNKSWELVAVEEYDWVKAFPAKGEGDGQFRFIIAANNSVEERVAVFNLLVDGEAQTTVFTVTQGARGEFIKADQKSFVLGYEAAALNLKVERNVEIELAPVSDDSGANASWITLAAQQPEAEDSLLINVAQSEQLAPRTAQIAIRMKNDPTIADTLTIFQAGTQELYGLPAVWRFNGRQAEEPYKSNWEINNKVPSDEGLGTFSFVTPDPINNNGNNKFGRTIGGTGDPYVTGAWPGDYWLYEIPAVVPANTLFNISFTGRVSGTGHKFWMLEYLDGEEWKPVGTVLSTEEPGEAIEYTHAMQNANAIVGGSFKVKNAMTSLKVRYRCMANWQSSGAGALAARNGGTARMTGDDQAELKIEVLGTNVGDLATVNMSAQHVALEGAEGSEGSFTFKSSEAWVLTTDAKWFEFTPASGAANEETTVTVKALNANDTGALRKANLVLNAGMSVINVEVVQGAAGSILSPFISVVGGSYFSVTPDAATYTAQVQTNVDFVATTTDEWITIQEEVVTRALVENKPLTFAVAASTGDKRVGKITLTNEQEGIETVLYVVQDKAPLRVEWLFLESAVNDGTAPYIATFGGLEKAATSYVKEAGDCGMYIDANKSGTGKIKYVQVDKTAIDEAGKSAHYVGGTGHPVVSGAWPGDYWLFEATDGEEYPAGTKLHINFITRISGTGQKCWMLEYWDGEAWQPASEYEMKTATVGDETVSYNFEPVTTTKNSIADATWTLVKPCTVMQFRYRCVANYNAKNEVLAAPNGGTCRIAGAEGTSPIFEVVK